MSRIIFVNRFYWPDISATAQLTTDLARALAAAGRRVAVIAGRAHYDDRATVLPARASEGGVQIYRIGPGRRRRAGVVGRAFDDALFHLAALRAMWRELAPGDLLVVETDPPLLCLPGWLVSRLRRAPLVTWNQDLFPEIAAALGLRVADGVVGRAIVRLRTWVMQGAAANVVLSEKMARHLRQACVPPERIRVVPNWAPATLRPEEAEAERLRASLGLGNVFLIVYAGNLGRAHLEERVCDLVFATAGLSKLHWLFVGGGVGMDRLAGRVEAAGLRHVTFLPYQQPSTKLAGTLSAADLHLVAQDPACEGLLFPTKLYGALAVGRPVAFLGAADGEIARLVVDRELGIVLDVERPEGWLSVLVALAADPQRRRRMGENALRLSREHYRRDLVIAHWQTLLDDVLAEVATPPTVELAS